MLQSRLINPPPSQHCRSRLYRRPALDTSAENLGGAYAAYPLQNLSAAANVAFSDPLTKLTQTDSKQGTSYNYDFPDTWTQQAGAAITGLGLINQMANITGTGARTGGRAGYAGGGNVQAPDFSMNPVDPNSMAPVDPYSGGVGSIQSNGLPAAHMRSMIGNQQQHGRPGSNRYSGNPFAHQGSGLYSYASVNDPYNNQFTSAGVTDQKVLNVVDLIHALDKKYVPDVNAWKGAQASDTSYTPRPRQQPLRTHLGAGRGMPAAVGALRMLVRAA